MSNNNINCEDCLYGDINFWGYEECWRINKTLDINETDNTADRELCARVNNLDGDCIYFIKK